MDLSTRYLGLDLPHPFMPGASPLVDDLDAVRRLEDAGAAAIVMHSLFEEQLIHEQLSAMAFLDVPADSFAEAASYLPATDTYALGPDRYLEQLSRVKEAVSVPVIGSLNGTGEGSWIEYGKLIEQAGADALELNFYFVATDPSESAGDVEDRLIRIVSGLKSKLQIPVAVKLSPYFTSLAHVARRLAEAGADGLVLLNRFYQADVDPLELEVRPTLHLSESTDLLLRLRWLAILSSQLEGVSLAATGGVHTSVDGVKAVMCGAHAVQVVALLLQRGPEALRGLISGFESWLEENEYDSVSAMRGAMNLARCPEPAAFERANYIRVLQSYRGLV